MKKIKILALIAIVVFVVQNVGEAVQNLVYGEPEPTQSKLYTDSYDSHLKLAVRPTDTCVPGTVHSTVTGTDAPFWATRIEAFGYIEPSASLIAMTFGLVALLLFALYGTYCLIRTIISVTRGDVFIRLNVRRMRFFVYSLMLLGAGYEVWRWLSYVEASQRLVLTGYEVVYEGLQFDWLPYVLLALFTELFAAGVKMKEEQDLTI